MEQDRTTEEKREKTARDNDDNRTSKHTHTHTREKTRSNIWPYLDKMDIPDSDV